MTETLAEYFKDRVATLGFIEPLRLAGLVRTHQKIDIVDNREFINRFPVATVWSAELCKSPVLVPESKFRSVSYFEGTESYPSGKEYKSTLTFVCWVNLKKFGETDNTKMLTDRFIAETLEKLNIVRPINIFGGGYQRLTSVVKAIQVKDPAIFGKYTYHEKEGQYLAFPYSYFAIKFEVSYMLKPDCLDIPEYKNYYDKILYVSQGQYDLLIQNNTIEPNTFYAIV